MVIDEKTEIKAQTVIVSGFTILGLLFTYVFDRENVARYLFIIAGVAGFIFIAIPPLAQLVVKGWFKLAQVLGWINTRILLSVVFFVFLFPFALLAKIGKKNMLQLKSPGETVFETRDHLYSKEDLKNPW